MTLSLLTHSWFLLESELLGTLRPSSLLPSMRGPSDAILSNAEVNPSPGLRWCMHDGDLQTQWYPLGYQLHAGGLGRLTVLVASQPLICATNHMIAAGELYIFCSQPGRRLQSAYCLEHSPRTITIKPDPD